VYTASLKFEPLVPSESIIMPALYIKLGIIKHFVKAMDKDGRGFKYLLSKFQSISTPKFKEGDFIGPDIFKLKVDTHFRAAVWNAAVNVIDNFLGNNKFPNYASMLRKSLGVNMSLKNHFLDSH